MATIAYEGPNGVEERDVDPENISDSGKVGGVRVRLDDESYLHIPDARLYSIAMSEEEGRVDRSPP